MRCRIQPIIFTLLFCVLTRLEASSTAIGYVIYREQGFHTDAQAKLIEVTSFQQFPAITKVVTTSGASQDIRGGQQPIFIPFPPAGSMVPEAALVKVRLALGRFPQHRTRLEAVQQDWNAYEAKLRSVATEAPKDERPKVTIQALDGRTFRDVVVSRQDPDGLSLQTDSGIVKVLFENLPEDIQQRYKFDPIAATKFREKTTLVEKKVNEPRQPTAEPASKYVPTFASSNEKGDARILVFGMAVEKAVKAKFGPPDREGEPGPYVGGYAKRVGLTVDYQWEWDYRSLPIKLQDCGIEKMMLGKIKESPTGAFWVLIGGIPNEQTENRILEFIGGSSDWTRSQDQGGMTLYENRGLRLFVSIKSVDFRGSRFSEIFITDLDILKMSLNRQLEQSGNPVLESSNSKIEN